jgi:hypothetical protein
LRARRGRSQTVADRMHGMRPGSRDRKAGETGKRKPAEGKEPKDPMVSPRQQRGLDRDGSRDAGLGYASQSSYLLLSTFARG